MLRQLETPFKLFIGVQYILFGDQIKSGSICVRNQCDYASDLLLDVHHQPLPYNLSVVDLIKNGEARGNRTLNFNTFAECSPIPLEIKGMPLCETGI